MLAHADSMNLYSSPGSFVVGCVSLARSESEMAKRLFPNVNYFPLGMFWHGYVL